MYGDPILQHEWRYAHGDNAHATIVFKNSFEFCGDVVEEFASYLAAVGFFQGNIIEAFESYVDEHKVALIRGAKRLDGESVDKYNIRSAVVGESE